MLSSYYSVNFFAVIDLAHIIQAEVDRQLGRDPTPVELVGIVDRPYNDLRYLLDYNKFNLDTGWSPKVSFEEGISLRFPSSFNFFVESSFLVHKFDSNASPLNLLILPSSFSKDPFKQGI